MIVRKMELESQAAEVLKAVGINKEHIVLDFGCGSGIYTIPTAKIVGDKGKVYALDKNGNTLNELMHRAESAGLKNIERIDTSGDSKVNLADNFVDVVLLFDVLHYYYFPRAEDRRQLLSEIYRVLRPNAVLSLYPTHLQSFMEPKLENVKREIYEANFYLESEYSGMLLTHGNSLEKGQVLNFRKKL